MLYIRILDRYIIIKYIVTFLTMLALFIPISVLVDLSQKIDNFNQYEIPASEILWYYYNFVWHFGFILFPIFLFLSVIWFTSKLSSNSEVIAMLGSGISFYTDSPMTQGMTLELEIADKLSGVPVVAMAESLPQAGPASYLRSAAPPNTAQLLTEMEMLNH